MILISQFFLKGLCSFEFTLLYYFVAVTVSFEKSSYTINKRGHPPSIQLHLNESVSTDVTVTVMDIEDTATSESLNSVINNIMMIVLCYRK